MAVTDTAITETDASSQRRRSIMPREFAIGGRPALITTENI